MAVKVALLLAAMAAMAAAAITDVGDMVPQESCYYQRHIKTLTCKCSKMDSSVRLNLRMKYYVFNQGGNSIVAFFRLLLGTLFWAIFCPIELGTDLQ